MCVGPRFEFSAVTRNGFTEAIIVVRGSSTGGNNYYRDNNWCIIIIIYILLVCYTDLYYIIKTGVRNVNSRASSILKNYLVEYYNIRIRKLLLLLPPLPPSHTPLECVETDCVHIFINSYYILSC